MYSLPSWLLTAFCPCACCVWLPKLCITTKYNRPHKTTAVTVYCTTKRNHFAAGCIFWIYTSLMVFNNILFVCYIYFCLIYVQLSSLIYFLKYHHCSYTALKFNVHNAALNKQIHAVHPFFLTGSFHWPNFVLMSCVSSHVL